MSSATASLPLTHGQINHSLPRILQTTLMYMGGYIDMAEGQSIFSKQEAESMVATLENMRCFFATVTSAPSFGAFSDLHTTMSIRNVEQGHSGDCVLPALAPAFYT